MLPITAVILTLNEEARITNCVQSLARAFAHVVIIDSFSQDQTLQGAEKAWKNSGRKDHELALILQQWRGFTQTRQSSLAWVKTPWVLWIDADEWVTPDFEEELKSKLETLPKEYSVFRLPRQSYFLGKAIRFGGWYPDLKARLARSSDCEWRHGPMGADVHEDLYSKTGRREEKQERFFNLGLEHEPFRSRQEQYDTNRRYSTLLAEGLAKKNLVQNKRPPWFPLLVVKPFIKFVENYVWKLGMLDGLVGFYIALGSAQSLYWRLQTTRRLMAKSKLEVK